MAARLVARLLALPARAIVSVTLVLLPALVAAGEPSHGFAYFGNLKYPKDMPHFDYANPDAAKGGQINLSIVGNFNNVHAYVDKGNLTPFMDTRLSSRVYDHLMRWSEDELASYYGLLAESVEVADDYSWVAYTLRDNAYWHDGEPVTVDDVLWTFKMLKTKASISWRIYYSDFDRVEQTGPRSFRFHFIEEAKTGPHLVVLTARFTTLPRHYWEQRDFTATTLEPPLGNGAYRLAEVEVGHKVVFERVEDYWGRDLNVNVGHHNFDRIVYTYYFDRNVMLQALRAGFVDLFFEEDEGHFHTAYDFEAYRQGLFKKETYRMGYSYGMHESVVLNNRRDLFKDIRVREALTLAYNFDWANRVYWHRGLERNNSYFMRSGMQAKGLPSAEELKLLEPLRDQVPERVFTQPVPLPQNDVFGRNRDTLLQADALLVEAGWVIKDFKRVNAQTGEPFTVEFIVRFDLHERMLVPFVENLKRLGIDAVLRKLESNLMTNRLRNYDFDATIRKLYTFMVPIPARMRSTYKSQSADQPAQTNLPGIKNPVVDFLVEKVLNARTEAEMNTAGRALDRVLLWNFYVIPEGCPLGRHPVYWDRFGHPPMGREHMNWTGLQLWWLDEEKNARVEAGLAGLRDE